MRSHKIFALAGIVTLYFSSAAYSIEQRTIQSSSPTQRAAIPAKSTKSDSLSQRGIIIVSGKKKPDAVSQRGIIIVSGKNKTVPAVRAPNAAMDRLQGM
jgi:hypothetical protein